MRAILSIILITSVIRCEGAKILAVTFIPSYSHQIFFRPFFEELGRRGHEVTFFTTHPLNDNSSKIREISTSDMLEEFEKHNLIEYVSSKNFTVFGLINKFLSMVDEDLTNCVCHPKLLEMIRQGEKFDLVFFEYIMSSHAALGYIFDCPSIGMLSMDAIPILHSSVGNQAHPAVNPDYNLPYTTNLSFRERLFSFISNSVWFLMKYIFLLPVQKRITHNCFGDTPDITSLEKNISLVFLNANPLLSHVRAVGPATINVGGKMHMTTPKPLPKQLQKLLDDSSQGAIYFSLGSNVKASSLNETLRQVLLETFSELPYTVLWKFGEDIGKLPKNVHIEKWYPQQSILRHPNIKLFITQGGLQSLEESIYNNVPMIGIPFFGDQFHNIKKIVEHGFGLSFDHFEMDKQSFKSAIIEVITNKKYKETLKEMAELSLDQPMTGLEKAVWWTEYVLRHKGAKLLRNPIIDLPWYQLYYLDIIGFTVICFGIFGTILYVFLRIFLTVLRCFMNYMRKIFKRKTE